MKILYDSDFDIFNRKHIFIYNNHKYTGRMKFSLGFKHLYKGLITYKYPLCCVLQFVKEGQLCIPSALKRYKDYGLVFGSKPIVMSEKLGDHVPCNKCMNKRIKMLQILKEII